MTCESIHRKATFMLSSIYRAKIRVISKTEIFSKPKITLSQFDRYTAVKYPQNRKRKVFYEEEFYFGFDDVGWIFGFCGRKNF